MSAPVKLALFVLVLVAVFTAGWVLGEAVGPTPAGPTNGGVHASGAS